MKPKSSFILHHDTLSVIKELTDEQAGQLLKAMYTYSESLNNPDNPDEPSGLVGLMNSVYHPFKAQILRDFGKYVKVCDRNRSNGEGGGRPPEPTGPQSTPDKPDKGKDSGSDNGKDNGSDRGKEIKPPSRLAPLSIIPKRSLPSVAILFSQFETIAVVNVVNRELVCDLLDQIPEDLHIKFIKRCKAIQESLEKDGLSRMSSEKLVKSAMQSLDTMTKEEKDEQVKQEFLNSTWGKTDEPKRIV